MQQQQGANGSDAAGDAPSTGLYKYCIELGWFVRAQDEALY